MVSPARFMRCGRSLTIGLLVAIVGCAGARARQATAREAAPAPGLPAVAAGAPDTNIAAVVDGHPIYLDEVGALIKRLPLLATKHSLGVLFPLALRRVIQRQAVVDRAESEGFDKHPLVALRMRDAAENVLMLEYLRRKIEPTITEAELHTLYDKQIKGRPGPEVVHAWAILVRTEAKAAQLISLLTAGADFATLARHSSIDVTAAQGGDLGDVQRNMLSPEIVSALFLLRPGEVTPYPVRTAGGWLVLKCSRRFRRPPLSFAAARPGLLNELIDQKAQRLVATIVAAASIRVYGMAGKATSAGR